MRNVEHGIRHVRLLVVVLAVPSLLMLLCRKDILPCRVYLRHCTLAAESLSPEAYESWLDDTFLADGETSIR